MIQRYHWIQWISDQTKCNRLLNRLKYNGLPLNTLDPIKHRDRSEFTYKICTNMSFIFHETLRFQLSENGWSKRRWEVIMFLNITTYPFTFWKFPFLVRLWDSNENWENRELRWESNGGEVENRRTLHMRYSWLSRFNKIVNRLYHKKHRRWRTGVSYLTYNKNLRNQNGKMFLFPPQLIRFRFSITSFYVLRFCSQCFFILVLIEPEHREGGLIRPSGFIGDYYGRHWRN